MLNTKNITEVQIINNMSSVIGYLLSDYYWIQYREFQMQFVINYLYYKLDTLRSLGRVVV